MSLVLEKAAELAAALENCDELKVVKEKQEALRSDRDAEEILSSFFQMQQQLYALQEQGVEPDDELMTQFNTVQDKMEQNMAVAEFYKSQEDLGRLLQQVNKLISTAITGEDSDGCSESDCAGCAGCS